MIFFVLLNVISLSLVAQERTLTGVVKDQNGDGIPGVSVKIKNSQIGVSTQPDGRFNLKVPASISGPVLLVSFVGYQPQEINIGAQNNFTIILKEIDNALDEVVVVGYGTQKKETLTGAIATVNEKAFKDKGALPSPLQALQGQVPGAVITRSSSAPGDESWAIQLRGASSVNATEPLTIVDGVIISSFRELRHINPSDIDNISFLKDAAAAIYGARAAGGVVIVTTKKAKNGKTTVQYDVSATLQAPGLQPDLLTVDQWANGAIRARQNDGFGEDDQWIKYARLALANIGGYVDLSKVANPIPNFADVNDYVFFNDKTTTQLIWGNAFSQSHNFSVAGRNDKVGYRLSLGYLDQGSMLQYGKNGNKRYNIRLVNDFKISDKFTIESNISYTRNDQVAPQQLGSAVTVSNPLPGFPERGLNGTPYAWGGNYSPIPFLEQGGENSLRVNVITLNEKLNYKITKDLNFVATLAYNPTLATRTQHNKTIQWYNYTGAKAGNINPGQTATFLLKSTNQEDYYTANAYIEYKKQFGKFHNFSLTGGTSYERNELDFWTSQVTDVSNQLDVLKGSGSGSVQTVSETKNHFAIGSYFARINYDYRSKYLLEGNIRYDGSSKFDSNNRWKPFYGVSAGWRISQEEFLKDSRIFNDLKLRASYGEMGNQSGIGLYDYVSLLNLNGNAAYFGTSLVSTVTLPNTLVSLNRTWERIQNYNLGIDFAVLSNKLSGTVEIFKKENKNMLLAQALPSVLGASAPAQNIGHLRTQGVEALLNWNDNIGDLKYNLGGTITYNKNNLINFGGANLIPSGGFNSTVQGYGLGAVFGYQYDGRIQTQEQLDAYRAKFANTASSVALVPTGTGLANGLQLGDNMYKDLNGDGKLDQADLVFLGTDDPRISYSFNAGLQWKGFDFNVIFQGVGKRTIYRDGNTWRIPFSAIFLNTTTQSIGKDWTPSNTGAYYPRYSTTGTINNYNYQSSTFSVENGAYLRLKNITLGYTLPEGILKKSKVFSSLRVYITGTDLWETTQIKDGWDPEATRTVTNGIARYPFYRSGTIGLNASF